jgi:chorismate mutase
MDLPIIPLADWGLPIRELFLAAGPCSAESEAQLLAAAKGLADCDVSFLRAGLWKPRTRPGSFEGVGLAGFEWLVKAREITGLPIGIEVATPEHVRACRDHNVDVVWIGARTTPNPFAVQALADALEGSDMPVLVKNPISPDLELWIGALERLSRAGLRKIGAIHRGFSTSERSLYRFEPHWKIPIELKRRLPNLPLLCDPSHICGNAQLIFTVAQQALDLLYDGLMVEVHPHPAEALSDAKQQLTPAQFQSLINRLTLKTELTDSEEFHVRINELRAEVDALDQNILSLLGERMAVARRMGDLKSKNHVSTLQPHRWQEIVASRVAAGETEGLARDFVFQVFETIHEESIRQQEERDPS